MDNIQGWFEEASAVSRVFSVLDREFIIYRGFKITKDVLGVYMIQDTRFSNMYAPVNKRNITMFTNLGFIKGVDNISYARDVKRVESYKRRTGVLYDKRKRYKDDLPNNKRLNDKRIRNINKRVQEYVDLLFFYQTRVQQFNFKYINNE
jgi:hypothetical protein